jgi:hypothetical protein
MIKLTHYAKRYSEAFDKFVNAPHFFKRLWQVNSNIKMLQRRQRVTLTKVVRVLLCKMTGDNNQIGRCRPDAMHGIKHTDLIELYDEMHGESISEGRWYRAIGHLVDAGYLKSKSSLTITGTDECPIIRSIASLKEFTPLFFADINLEHKKDIRVSRAKGVASRIAAGLSNVWYGYIVFNRVSKRKFAQAVKSTTPTYTEVPYDFDNDIFGKE